MKKRRIMWIMLVTAIVAVMALGCSAPVALADGGAEVGIPVSSVSAALTESLVQAAGALLLTLIGALGTYLTSLIAKNEKLKTVQAATQEAIEKARITVGELQQTVVNGLKAAHADGKLTEDEIKKLGKDVIDKTLSKMSQPALDVLAAAYVDVTALIKGVAEDWIGKLKRY